MEFKKNDKKWHEVETNSMWRDINVCDNPGELSKKSWGNLKKIAKNMCSADFTSSGKYKILLECLLYKDGYGLREITQTEDELQFVIECLCLSIEKCNGDINDLFEDKDNEYTNSLIGIYAKIGKHIKEDYDRTNIAENTRRQFYRILDKFNMRSTPMNGADVSIDMFLSKYENMMIDSIEYGEEKSSFSTIYRATKEYPQHKKRLVELYIEKLKQDRAKQDE